MRGVIRKGLGVAAGLLLLVPASALAGEASVDPGGIPRYQAFDSEANNLSVAELPGPNASLKTIRFSDFVPVSAGVGCSSAGAFSANCVVPQSTNLVRAGLEDGNDRIHPDATNPPATVRFSAEGEPGNDVMIGTIQNDILDGEGDRDSIFGGPGVDNLQGADGDDRIDGGVNSDTISGGGGDDRLDGVDGDDHVAGNAGVDQVDGGNGRDQVDGGAQADRVVGGPDPDYMLGGTGNDVLDADDGAGDDRLDCGDNLFDNDFAILNLGDIVSSNCEQKQTLP